MKLHDLVDDPSKLATYGKFISPEEAYERLKQGDKAPYLIKAIASDPNCAYYYARHVIKVDFQKARKRLQVFHIMHIGMHFIPSKIDFQKARKQLQVIQFMHTHMHDMSSKVDFQKARKQLQVIQNMQISMTDTVNVDLQK